MLITEPNRLATVRRFENLKLNENEELNNLVTLTAKICKVSMASVTLMDESIQWVKCSTGITITQENREESFCKYLINTTKVMVVPDALLDKRFIDYPSVTRAKGIRFYAGVPLITTSGYHLGALCVYGIEPNLLSTKQKQMLSFISKQIMHMMEMLLGLDFFKHHHADIDFEKKKLALPENNLKAFFNGSSSTQVLVDKELQVLDFNKASSTSIKQVCSKNIQKGKNVLQYISASFQKEFMKYLKYAFKGKATIKEVLINHIGGIPQWWDVRFEPVFDEHGKTISVAYSASDITEQKRQVAEIFLKNESLLNIAFLQSHVYRKPVASILGLMNVIKENNYESPKECLLLMERAVTDLDDKIKSILNYTQNLVL